MPDIRDDQTDMPLCITCSDAADPMRVASIEPSSPIGKCIDVAGHRSDVMLDLVPDAVVGDEVLVHAGVALCVVPRRAPTEGVA